MLTFDFAGLTKSSLSLALGALTLTTVLACSSAPPPPAMVEDSGAETSVEAGPAGYTIKSLGCGAAGTQSVVAVSGSTVAFASLAPTTKTQTCTLMGPPVMTSNVQLFDVCYAAGEFGGSYTSQVVTSQPYEAAEGVGLAFNPSGSPTIAFSGVGSTPAMDTCGANDVFVTSLQTGAFTTPVQVSHGSMADGLIASQASNCAEDVCDMGDTTGFWPAVGIDSSGNAFIPFRDVHFGFAMDDFAKSCVDLAEEESGGAYFILDIDVARGGGEYNRIAFDPAGLPAVVQYNSNMTGESPGVYINRQVKPGSPTAQEASGVWVSAQIFAGQLGAQGQLGFAISPKGLYAVAYYDNGQNLLMYTESMNGTTWSTATPVDTFGYTGWYPSLAFDASGNPAIAYYRCNDQGPSVATCDPATDGLYLARRTGMTWNFDLVSQISSLLDGMYPALAFVNGKAVIAFQENSYDAVTMKSSFSWWVAEEP